MSTSMNTYMLGGWLPIWGSNPRKQWVNNSKEIDQLFSQAVEFDFCYLDNLSSHISTIEIGMGILVHP